MFEIFWIASGLLGSTLILREFYNSYEKITLGQIIFTFVIGSIFGVITLAMYCLVWVINNVDLSFLDTVIFQKKKNDN